MGYHLSLRADESSPSETALFQRRFRGKVPPHRIQSQRGRRTMFLTLLIEAVLGGTVETLTGAGIEKASHRAERIQRAVDMVER